jgi:L-lactate dehydrogenase complex protein LldG
MSSRDDILARIRKNAPPAQPMPSIPTFDATGSALENFKAALLRMGGKIANAPVDGDLDALVRRLFPDARIICSATREVTGNRPLDQVRSPADLNDVDIGVVRATYGVAETGSVWLNENAFKVNTLGFLAQHLVVLLDPSASSATCTMPTANARNSTFATAYS